MNRFGNIFTVVLVAILVFLMSSLVFVGFADSINSTSAVGTSLLKQDGFTYPTGTTTNPWLQHSFDAGHTGFNTGTGPTTNHTLWAWQGNGEDFYTGFPTVADGKLFIGLLVPYPNDNVYALDAYTGAVVWTWNPSIAGIPGATAAGTNETMFASPVVSDGKVFVREQGYGQRLFVLNERDGHLMWYYDAGGGLGGSSAVVVSGGLVYLDVSAGSVPMQNRSIIALNENTGKKIWQTFARDPNNGNWSMGDASGTGATGLTGTPAVGAGIIAFETKAFGTVVALNVTTGKWLWTYQTLPVGAVAQYDPVIAYNTVYYGNANGSLVALNPLTGAVRWSYQFTGGSAALGNGCAWDATAAYGMIFIGSYNGQFRAFNATTGDVIWTVNNGANIWHAAAAVVDGKVYAGSFDGWVYCFDAFSGNLIWKYQMNPSAFFVDTGPTVADGIAYVGTYNVSLAFWSGSGEYDAGGVFRAFGKGPTETNLAIPVQQVINGSSVTICGSIADQSPASPGAPVTGVPVALSYDAGNGFTNITMVMTDSEGLFSYSWTPTSIGTYKIRANFSGTGDYGWSSAELITQVQSSPEPYPTAPPYPTFAPYPTPVSAQNVANEVTKNLTLYQAMEFAIVVVLVVVAVLVVYNTLSIRKLRK